jgi:hypothetical protein
MFNNIKRVAAVIALTGWMGVANASLIFDFSYGTTGNELVGEITGLVDGIDGLPQNTAIIRFTTTTGIYAAFQEFGVIWTDPKGLEDANLNRFEVVNRQITSVQFEYIDSIWDRGRSVDIKYEVEFFTSGRLNARSSLNKTARAERSDFNGFVNRVAPTPAPEPSAVFLLALGLAGVSFSRYKKKS